MRHGSELVKGIIGETCDIVGVVRDGSNVTGVVIGKAGNGFNAAAGVLPSDVENNIVVVTNNIDAVSVGILHVAEHAVGEVTDVVFTVPQSIVVSAFGNG